MQVANKRNGHFSNLLYVKLGIIGITLLLAVYSFSYRKAHAFAGGPPAARTNAPGETNCTACHATFELNTGPGSLQILGLPESYSPNQEIPITVKLEQLDAISFGFQLTAIDATGKRAGQLVITDQDNTQLRSATVDGNQRSYIEQTFNGSIPVEFNQREWTFNWIAPDAPIGPVSFYLAGNAADGNGRPTNDHIYTTSTTLPPAETPSGFNLNIEPTTQTITAGSIASYTINVSSTSGFTGEVSLSVDGLPGESNVNFQPPTINTPGSSIMTISTNGSTPAGSYTLTISGTSGNQQKTSSIELVVENVVVPPTIILEPIVSGLASTDYVTNARDGSNRLFILEQPGRIKVLQPGETTPTDFLNITSKVLSGGERGLLGLAFHPQFSSNRRFFLNYTRRPDGATVIAEYLASETDPNLAIDDEKVILVIPQPFSNHNGGMIEFGHDGYLYIAMGDGGSANDPGNRAQNIEELLGKILRIDINNPDGDKPYSSPPSNPFYGETPGRDEIYATGLRNPWRFSFDKETGQLFAADVGQGTIEEVDIIHLGGNYGWRVFEGTRCTNLDPVLCNTGEYIGPITEYGHQNGRCSVTGGYVYRGTAGTLPAGTYVFADYCSGEIFTFSDGIQNLLLDTDENISSFGEDEAGELYVVGHRGSIYRITKLLPPDTCAPDITGQLNVKSSRFTFRPKMQLSVRTVTITNTSAQDIQGPFTLVLDELSNVTLLNATDSTKCSDPKNSPYLTVNEGNDNVLSPGESLKFKLRFTNPDRLKITYKPRILAGPGSR
jgi:glucose/arabinose dehydrogenase